MRFLGLLSCQQMTIVSLLCLAAFVSTSWVCVAQEADDRPSAVVECHWADDTLTIDGVADEKAWQQAQKIDNFRKPWLPNDEQSPRTATTARLLWDRESLYFFAEMEDTDVYANVRAHDGRTWTNDVLEVFLKPSADKSGYYEFQVNAAATVLDMFLPRRGSGGYERFKSDGEFRIEAKVSVNGSLNNWSDRDQSWSVEGRIPWRDLIRTGGRPEPGETWQFALARYDYSVDFEGPELSTTAPLTHRDFHRHEEYARLRFVRPAPAEASAKYGLKPYTRTSQVVGSPDPPLPYTVTRVLPKLMVSWPIGVMSEPGSRRLWIIDQRWPYGPSRLARTTSDPADSTLETLVDFGNAVAHSIPSLTRTVTSTLA